MTAATPMCVFVVDDDRDTTEYMRLLLQHWGHEVHVANHGVAAIEQAPLVKPDLMLIDLAMPEVDGLTVARRVRLRPENAITSLVALTGYGDAQHREEAIEAGFDECHVKPLPADELLKLLTRVQSRIAAASEQTSLPGKAAASRNLNDPSPRGRSEQFGQPKSDGPKGAGANGAGAMAVATEPVLIRVQKSGISDMVLLEDRGLAEQLRQWLRERGCRVGPVFEPAAGQAGFFTYSRRQARTLLAGHPSVRLEK